LNSCRNSRLQLKIIFFPEKVNINSLKPSIPNGRGALPYTLLVEPGGKIVFAKEGIMDPAELKKAIVENKYIGRYY